MTTDGLTAALFSAAGNVLIVLPCLSLTRVRLLLSFQYVAERHQHAFFLRPLARQGVQPQAPRQLLRPLHQHCVRMRLAGHSVTVLVEQIRITKYIFMDLNVPFSENHTALHKLKVLSFL